MNHQDITDCRTATPIEVDPKAMHDVIAAQTEAFLRSHAIEQIPRGVHGEDYTGSQKLRNLEVTK